MNIYGSLVIKNEADRYLEDCIKWMRPHLSRVFVFDDRSTDDSAEIAKDLGCTVVVRGENTESFLDHEARFRSAAWAAFESSFDLNIDDWILSFDADEFLVSKEGSVEDALNRSINQALKHSRVGVVLPFAEIFGVENGVPQQRVDGFWGSVRGPRLFRYQTGASWNNKAMGCGSEPLYVDWRKVSHESSGLYILHYGYARSEDVKTKYKRYSSLIDHGHADTHIQSIVSNPTLVPWDGPIPEVSV